MTTRNQFAIRQGKTLPKLHLTEVIRLLDWAVETDLGYEVNNDTSPCWIWKGFKDVDGYGQIKYRGKKQAAHRASFTAFRGEIPASMDVNHLCGNRACINPAHLELQDAHNHRSQAARQPREAIPF
jgi:hypothetical protein